MLREGLVTACGGGDSRGGGGGMHALQTSVRSLGFAVFLIVTPRASVQAEKLTTTGGFTFTPWVWLPQRKPPPPCMSQGLTTQTAQSACGKGIVRSRHLLPTPLGHQKLPWEGVPGCQVSRLLRTGQKFGFLCKVTTLTLTGACHGWICSKCFVYVSPLNPRSKPTRQACASPASLRESATCPRSLTRGQAWYGGRPRQPGPAPRAQRPRPAPRAAATRQPGPRPPGGPGTHPTPQESSRVCRTCRSTSCSVRLSPCRCPSDMRRTFRNP